MRILTLNHEYPPLGGGGGKACQDIALELSSRGHEVVVLTSGFHDLPAHEIAPNLRVIRLRVARKREYQAGLFTMTLYVIRSTLYGFRYIRKWRPDLIHVHFAVPAGVTAYLIKKFTGIPYMLTTHLGDIPGGSPHKTQKWFRWFFPFTRAIWREAAQVTTVSAFTAALAYDSYGNTPIIVPNGLQIRQSVAITLQNPPVILFAGRFVPQKNLGIFLEVLEAIRDLPWECVMLGDGPLQKEVEEKISYADLDERIYLPGWVTPEQVIKMMEKSDILFMPSLTEGLPVVGVQALEAGLAIVASNVGGFVDLVDQGHNGMLHSPSDTEGMKKALRMLLSDKRALLAARLASREIVKKFDIKTVASKYENLMFEVLRDVT